MLRLDSPIGCSHATYYGAVAHVATNNAIVAARDAIAATLPPEQPLRRCGCTSQVLGRW
jgi:hypothetical protein